MHSCCSALFYCLLFNLNLNSFEFEFKLNMFESFQKCKAISFPLLVFSPAGRSLSPFLPLPFFLFLPAAQNLAAAQSRPARPSPPTPSPFLPLSLTRETRPLGPSPSSCRAGTPSSPGAARVGAAFLARTPRAPGRPLFKAPHPLNLIKSSRRLLVLAQP